MTTHDRGEGFGYQFFFGDSFYISPTYLVYHRKKQTIEVGGKEYSIPTRYADLILRFGYRF